MTALKANLVQSNNNNRKRYENKSQGCKLKNSNLKRNKGSCFICGKSGHHASQCRYRAGNVKEKTNTPKANLAEGGDIIAVNIVAHAKEWVVDSGATRHICTNREAFSSYTPVEDDREEVYLGDSSSVLSLNGVRLRLSCLGVVMGDTTAVPNGAVNEQIPSVKLSDSSMRQVNNPIDWRRLLAFSKEWNSIRPHFYNRCQNRADSESDPGMMHKLLRLQRKMREVDDDVKRHNKLLEVIRRSPSEVGDIVSRRRKDFTKEFFAHLHTVAESYYDDVAEQNAVAKLGNTCLAAVQAYDKATESIEALNAAELKFQDITNSPSVDAACKKIDDLAQKNQLDSALVLMITKAWSAAKESDMTKDEVKDVLYHLYTTARGNLQRLMPKEIRILKYLLTIEDPEERLCTLKDAFTPGEELEGKDVNCLYTYVLNLIFNHCSLDIEFLAAFVTYL
nr:uncharacterized protein At4g37920-like [Nicotiana tomentosiformis]